MKYFLTDDYSKTACLALKMVIEMMYLRVSSVKVEMIEMIVKMSLDC